MRKELYYPYIEIMRDCRQQANISQSTLAEIIEISNKYVTLIERNKRLPTVECLLCMMAASGVQRATAEQMVLELVDMLEWQE